MAVWSRGDRRLGLWSAVSVVLISLIYLLVGLIGLVERPPNLPALRQVDPFLAILEFLIILTAVSLVAMMAAVHAYASPAKKSLALVALGFMLGFALVTISTHFASLTVGRLQAETSRLLLQQLSMVEWPSLALSLDLMAWDFLLGLSLLFGSGAFEGNGPERSLRRAMQIGGTLCLVATLGPVSGHMRLQYFGIAGYAFGLPVVCALAIAVFARKPVAIQ
jgi:hypothetical protein